MMWGAARIATGETCIGHFLRAGGRGGGAIGNAHEGGRCGQAAASDVMQGAARIATGECA